MHAHRKPVSRGVDVVDYPVEVFERESRYMKDGAEALPGNLAYRPDFERHGSDVGAGSRDRAGLGDQLRARAQIGNVFRQFLARLRVDHRSDVGRRIGGIADAQRGHRTPKHVEHRGRDLLLQVQDAKRAATLAGRAKGAGHHSVHDLLGQRARIHDHGVQAARFGDQGRDGALALRENALNRASGDGRAGEGNARDPRIGDKSPPDPAVAGQKMKGAGRDPRLQNQLGDAVCGERSLLRRLRNHRVAGDQRGRDLSRENRDRKVPGADAREHAAAVQRQHVALADRPGQRHRAAEPLARLLRVIAAEIHRFAYVRHGIGQGLPSLPDAQSHQARHIGLQQIGQPLQCRGAFGHADRGPGDPRGVCAIDRGPHHVRRCFTHFADGQVGPRGRHDRPSGTQPALAVHERSRGPCAPRFVDRFRPFGERGGIPEVMTPCNASLRHVQLRW